jgi:hypothetical protein
MKRRTTAAGALAATVLIASASPAVADDMPPNPVEKPGYTLDFAEEFEGTTLDTDTWLPHYLPHWVAPENIDDTAARYTVSDGTIKLRVEQDQPPWNPDQDGTVVSSAIQTFNATNWHPFNGLAVNRNALPTFDGYSTKYGYFEVRAKKSNAGGGGHQAVWLVGTDTSTSAQPEIDFIESFFSKPSTWRIAAYGWGSPDFVSSWVLDEVEVPGTPTEEFHVYGMDWTPWELKFYYDGELVKTINDAPNQPMGIIMNIYTGAGSGQPNDVWPKQWEVDYLRVYKSDAGYSEELSATWKLLASRHLPGYVHVAAGDQRVRHGDSSAADWAAQWQRETTGTGDTRLRNRLTNEYLALTSDGTGATTQANSPGTKAWKQNANFPLKQQTSVWRTVDVGGGYFRLENLTAPGALHVENGTGYLEYGAAGPGWWSAQWQLKAAPAR